MVDVLKQLGSPAWWFGVVFVGIAINIISPYIRSWLESGLIRISARHNDRAAAREAKRAQFIEILKTDAHKEMMYALQEHRLRIRSLQNLVCGLLALAAAVFIEVVLGEVVGGRVRITVTAASGLVGLVAFLFALDDTRRAIQIKQT